MIMLPTLTGSCCSMLALTSYEVVAMFAIPGSLVGDVADVFSLCVFRSAGIRRMTSRGRRRRLVLRRLKFGLRYSASFHSLPFFVWEAFGGNADVSLCSRLALLGFKYRGGCIGGGFLVSVFGWRDILGGYGTALRKPPLKGGVYSTGPFTPPKMFVRGFLRRVVFCGRNGVAFDALIFGWGGGGLFQGVACGDVQGDRPVGFCRPAGFVACGE